MTHVPQPFVDYQPLVRHNGHQLEPGMVVRPRRPDGHRMDDKRWVVERVSGAMTRCKRGGPSRLVSQYWATDSLIPVKFKKTVSSVAERETAGAETRMTKKSMARIVKVNTFPAVGKPAADQPEKKKARTRAEPDELALALKECHGLDQLLKYARSRGYPQSGCVDIRRKTTHLNPGLQRMNVGNRLRVWLRTL